MKTDYRSSNLTPAQSFRKAADYCAFQERCTSEVIQKCKQWGMPSNTIREIIKTLISENYINELRFASAFVRGKFKNNKWGRIKIIAELKLRQIPDAVVYESLNEIDEQDYTHMIVNLAEKKLNQLGIDTPENRQKILRYLISKGFETGLVLKVVNEQ